MTQLIIEQAVVNAATSGNPNNDESIVARIIEELGHREHYGQESKVISLGTGAYEEACRLGCILGDTFFGMTLLIDPALKPTCFEIR